MGGTDKGEGSAAEADARDRHECDLARPRRRHPLPVVLLEHGGRASDTAPSPAQGTPATGAPRAEAAAFDPSSPPPRFDDFELIRALGRGGMGTVYLARDVVLDRMVAVKLLGEHARDPRARDRFAIEARALARIHHRNVVAAYRGGVVDGRPYLAQELIAGPRLDELPRPAPWAEVWRIALGLSRALAAVHALHVVHRDVKPSNVMLGGDHEIKLIDFGLASVRGDGDLPARAPRPGRRAGRITEDGTIIGTPKYIAPEIWDGHAASPRSDVHAMGLVLYELLVGTLPHGHLVGAALSEAARLLVLPRLARTWCHVPGPFAELIDRCVHHQPDERPTAAEVAAELESSYVRPPPDVESSADHPLASIPLLDEGETEAISAVTVVEALSPSSVRGA